MRNQLGAKNENNLCYPLKDPLEADESLSSRKFGSSNEKKEKRPSTPTKKRADLPFGNMAGDLRAKERLMDWQNLEVPRKHSLIMNHYPR